MTNQTSHPPHHIFRSRQAIADRSHFGSCPLRLFRTRFAACAKDSASTRLAGALATPKNMALQMRSLTKVASVIPRLDRGMTKCFRISTHLLVNISRRRQVRQLTGGGGVLLHAQRSEHVKGRSRQDPKCGLSATGLAAAGNINDVWDKMTS